MLPVVGSPDPRVPPFVIRNLHVHGAPAYGSYTTRGPRTGLGPQLAKAVVQDGQRSRTETCAKRCAQCGPEDMGLQKQCNYCIC